MTFRTFFTRALAVTVSVGVMVVTLSPAEAQTKVRFALDWQIQGPQAPFIAAKILGAFSGAGLDVTIDRGTGSQKTIEQVATGTYDLGYGDINSMIEYNVKNPGNPLVAVYMVLNTPPFSLLSLKKYGVKESQGPARASASARRRAMPRDGSGPSSPRTSASPRTA